jgi:MFS family permease
LNAQVAGALVSAPIGKLSDTIGFKKLVIASCIMIGAVYAGFIAVILDPRLDFVYMLGLLFGVANGAFLAVDYALACDVLVNKDEIGRDMGLWGVGAFVGTTLGPIILGPMLQSYSIMDADGKVTAFGDQGYVLVFTFGIVNITIAALLVSKIKGSR